MEHRGAVILPWEESPPRRNWLARKLWPHKSFAKCQGPDEYMRAKCTCGASFKALDGRFGLGDFERWEREHRRAQPER